MEKMHRLHVLVLLVDLLPALLVHGARGARYASAVGDPGMRRDGLRVAFEAWNFCNEVGEEEASDMGSPRAADCFDVNSSKPGYRGSRNSKPMTFPFDVRVLEDVSRLILLFHVNGCSNPFIYVTGLFFFI